MDWQPQFHKLPQPGFEPGTHRLQRRILPLDHRDEVPSPPINPMITMQDHRILLPVRTACFLGLSVFLVIYIAREALRTQSTRIFYFLKVYL